jgi:hypothetical protein
VFIILFYFIKEREGRKGKERGRKSGLWERGREKRKKNK